MSALLTVYDNEDLPCQGWKDGQHKDITEPCPMKEKWHDGEVRMCGVCGWEIGYNVERED